MNIDKEIKTKMLCPVHYVTEDVIKSEDGNYTLRCGKVRSISLPSKWYIDNKGAIEKLAVTMFLTNPDLPHNCDTISCTPEVSPEAQE
jgi:hypothetical protein